MNPRPVMKELENCGKRFDNIFFNECFRKCEVECIKILTLLLLSLFQWKPNPYFDRVNSADNFVSFSFNPEDILLSSYLSWYKDMYEDNAIGGNPIYPGNSNIYYQTSFLMT